MKERVIGACVLVILAIIFIPMLFDSSSQDKQTVTQSLSIPEEGPTHSVSMSLTDNSPAQPVSSYAKPAASASQTSASTATSGKMWLDNKATSTNIAQGAPQSAHPTQHQSVGHQSTGRQATKQATASPTSSATSQTPQQTSTPHGSAKANHSASTGVWAVQAGSFVKADNANTLARRLTGHGLDAYVEKATSGGRQVYRVRVGHLATRAAAEAKAPAVHAITKIATQVVSNP